MEGRIIVGFVVGALFFAGAYLAYANTFKAKDSGSASDLSPRQTCEKLCSRALAEGMDLSNGPCLSGNITTGWVCDVAHSPRQAVDNEPINQCPEYGKSAQHFVEVSPSCIFIRQA